MNLIDFPMVIFEFLLLMVIPGFFLSLIIFKKDKFTLIERIYISAAINIFLVIAIAVLLDMVLGVDITAENMRKSLFLITILSFFIWIIEPRNIKRISKIRI